MGVCVCRGVFCQACVGMEVEQVQDRSIVGLKDKGQGFKYPELLVESFIPPKGVGGMKIYLSCLVLGENFGKTSMEAILSCGEPRLINYIWYQK